MIDIAWSEFFLVLIIALIFLGPKELLTLMRSLGQFFGKIQAMRQNAKMMMDYELYKIDAEKKVKQDESPRD
jgi:sec-independent protein translocase protein TatB